MFKRFFLTIFCGLMFFSNAQAFDFSHLFTRDSQQSLAETILSETKGLNPQVLNLALASYDKLRKEGYDKQQVLTIVDYSKPSTERRMWVINLKNMKVAFHTLVAHGMNTGGNMAKHFSNRPETHESSLGVYLTGNTYMGEHGYSLRLNGLEPGFNSNALSRDIVMHSAYYVSHTFADEHGRLGRSWGCLALDPKIATPVIHDIKDGTVIFAYYPDKQWLHQLKHTQFLRT